MEFDGKRIKAAAAQANISLTELAEKLGISRSTMYAYIGGAIAPPQDRVAEIASLTGCPIEFFTAGARSKAALGGVSAEQIIEALLAGSDRSAAADMLQQFGESLPADRRAEFLLRLANGLALEGRYQEAIEWGTRARATFEGLKLNHEVGRCAQTLGFCFTNTGPISRALTLFLEAQSLLKPDHKWKAQIALAAIAERRGDFDRALQTADAVRGSSTDETIGLYCLGLKADTLACLSRWHEAFEAETEALALAERLDARDQTGERLIRRAFAALYVRDPAADCMVAQARGFHQSSNDRARQTFFGTLDALFAIYEGRLAEAESIALRALEGAISGQYRRSELGAQLRLIEIAILRKALAEAQKRSVETAAHAQAFGYAAERDYADALGAVISAVMGQHSRAAQVIGGLNSRSSWKANRAVCGLISFVRDVLAGEQSARIEAVAPALVKAGVRFAPGFEPEGTAAK